MDLFHGSDEAGIPECEILLDSIIPIVAHCLGHDFIECTLYDVNFLRTFDVQFIRLVANHL